MPRADARAYSDNHAVFLLVGDNLIQQRQQSGTTPVHDGASADLDYIHVGQNGGDLGFGPRQHFFVHQRLAHQAGMHVLRVSIGAHCVPPLL